MHPKRPRGRLAAAGFEVQGRQALSDHDPTVAAPGRALESARPKSPVGRRFLLARVDQPRELDGSIETLQLLSAARPGLHAGGTRKSDRRDDVARASRLDCPRGQVHDRPEDVAVAQQQITTREAGSHIRDARVLAVDPDQLKRDR